MHMLQHGGDVTGDGGAATGLHEHTIECEAADAKEGPTAWHELVWRRLLDLSDQQLGRKQLIGLHACVPVAMCESAVVAREHQTQSAPLSCLLVFTQL